MSTQEKTFVPGLAGVPATESSVSYIDGNVGVLEYRGYPIEELSEHSTFEETAFLLWEGRLPKADELAQFRDEYPHIRVTDVSGAGHMVAGDRNDVFADAVEAFVETL